ncbi:hypothetical protein [Aeromonas rivipollensis]
MLLAALPSPPERLFGGCRQQPDAGGRHVDHQAHHITRRDLPGHISASPRSNNCQYGGDMDLILICFIQLKSSKLNDLEYFFN